MYINMLSNTYAWRLQPAFLSIFFFCQYAGIYLDIILGNESETDFYSWKSNEGRYFLWNSNLKKNTLCSARERARAHHLRVSWSEWQNVNLNIFHFFCVLEIVQIDTDDNFFFFISSIENQMANTYLDNKTSSWLAINGHIEKYTR